MMRKIILFWIAFFSLTCLILAGEAEKELKKKGIHVAELSEEDKINLQINKLEQAIRQQSIGDVIRILSPDYSEENPSFNKNRLSEILDSSFSSFAKNRGFLTQVNKKTGWTVTAIQDFYIHNVKIQIDRDKAKIECDVGFFLASDQITKESLTFSKVGSNWVLLASQHFFSFIENASAKIRDSGHFADVFGNSPILSLTEEDFASTHLLIPTLLYIYNGTPISRMNMTTSQQLFGFRHKFVQPYGIMADVQVTPGSSDFTYEYLWVTEAMGDFVVASDQDEWMADYGEWGSGIGQFKGPYGISNFPGHYFVADMFNNRVITYYYEKGWDAPTWEATLTADFDWPIDVDAKDVPRTSPPEDVQYIAVADWRNHRIVFFHGWPYRLNFDRSYGQYGSGQGQFILPTSVCFGRDPETGWQTNEVFVTDSGNDRLVWLYINPDTSTIYWRGTYQFLTDVELTSVDVDNKGLVYVVDRRNGKVYKFAVSQDYPYDFSLLGVWGETGTADGQLDHPNTLQVAHGRYCPYPEPCVPLTSLGDVFVTESWGDLTGVRRFVIAADVLNLSATYVPYNEDTGEGNYIWYTYNLTDFANVTEQVYRGGEVCTTYNRGALNYGSQGGNWNVDGHPHGQNYTVKITATSIYGPTVVKTVDVYVDTMTIHNPIIQRGIRCEFLNDPYNWCDGCYQCIKKGYSYTVDVQAYDPHGDSLTYEWSCGKGYLIYAGNFCRRITIPENYICYQAPTFGKNGSESPKSFESFTSTKDRPDFIGVTVRNPYGGETSSSVNFTPYDESTSCLCGDVNHDSSIDASDFVFLLNYLFVHGPSFHPTEIGDVNNDCVVDVSDLIYLLNYLFVHGPQPKCCWIYY